MFAIVLACVGVFSMASAFAQSYAVFFVKQLIVATAGITFVIGIQHVSEWFPEEQLGTAEGIYAGIGNAGRPAGRSSCCGRSGRRGAAPCSRRTGGRRFSTPESHRS